MVTTKKTDTDEEVARSMTERELVKRTWATMTGEQRTDLCRTCVSFFPQGSEEFECLSGHGIRYAHPCSSYQRATFRLCDDFEYSPRQVYLIREFERECKKHRGLYEDDEDDD